MGRPFVDLFSPMFDRVFSTLGKKTFPSLRFSPTPEVRRNSEVNRITIKFLRCNYHEREIAGETISSILCIKSLILFLKSIPLPLFLLLSPLVSSNLNNSQSSHVSRRPRECRRQIWQIGFEIEQVPRHSPPPSPIRLEIYSNTRPSFPINETEGITSAYIADYSRLRGEKNNLGFVLHFRGPSTLPPFSSPFGILGAKIFYNNNDRRNSKNAIHGIFHTIRYHHNPTKEKKESRKEDYHFE